jgi:response regulator of citrate/malate metabolism
MSDSLDVIIVDDDPNACELLKDMVESFYSWGHVRSFSDLKEARDYCLTKEVGVSIFILDVFLKGKTGFGFLDDIVEKFPMAHEDTIMISGRASDDVVNACIASDITYLLEKPVRPYALQLTVRAIVSKYVKFAKRLLQDPELAESISGF